MSAQSDTPRTDAVCAKMPRFIFGDTATLYDLAQQLERDLAHLRKRLEAAEGLANTLEEFADVGREYYEMDMGKNGSRMLEAADKALKAFRATEGKK